MAIKKAVIDVTSCLQDCPPYEKDEVDLSLGAGRRRRSGSSGEPMCSLLPTYSENIATDGDNKKPNEQSQVQFRMICSHGAGSVLLRFRPGCVSNSNHLSFFSSIGSQKGFGSAA